MMQQQVISAVESGKTVRLDGGAAGVRFASSVQQFWEAVREFEALGSNYSVEILK